MCFKGYIVVRKQQNLLSWKFRESSFLKLRLEYQKIDLPIRFGGQIIKSSTFFTKTSKSKSRPCSNICNILSNHCLDFKYGLFL